MNEFLENTEVVRNEWAIWSLVEVHSGVSLRRCLFSQKWSRSLTFERPRPRTFHSYDPWCSPGSSSIPLSLSRSHRRGHCTGRAGNSEIPSTQVSTGHTAECTPPGNSGTGQWWGHRKHWQILADCNHKLKRDRQPRNHIEKLITCKHIPHASTLVPSSEHSWAHVINFQNEALLPEAVEPTPVFLRKSLQFFWLTYVCIHRGQSQRCREHICHRFFQPRLAGTRTGLRWGRRRNLTNPEGHTHKLQGKETPEPLTQSSCFPPKKWTQYVTPALNWPVPSLGLFLIL